MSVQKLDTLADGRGVFRYIDAGLAGDFQPGLCVSFAQEICPVLKRDQDALWLIAKLTPEGQGTLTGSPWTPPENSPLICCQDDELFSVLAWFFAQPAKRRERSGMVVAGFSAALPFRPQPSKFLTPQCPPHVTAAVPLLEDWGIVSRIAHAEGSPGCFEGELGQLAALFLP